MREDTRVPRRNSKFAASPVSVEAAKSAVIRVVPLSWKGSGAPLTSTFMTPW